MAITPYLYYSDVGGVLKFLARAFGFRRYGPEMHDGEGRINHAAMKFGKDVVMMGRPGDAYQNPKRLGHSTQALYINVKNVDKHFAHARKTGATVIEELVNTPYGDRRCGFEDPEGHKWYFAQTLPRRKTKTKRKAR